MRPTIFERASIRRVRSEGRVAPTGSDRFETDGGAVDEDGGDTAFTVYSSDAYRYQIEYPTEWIAEADPPGGMFFSAPDGGASAFVFVDDETGTDVSLSDYIESFFAGVAADEYISTFERREERTTTLPSGQSGTIIEYTYTDDAPCEQWCCTYCFAIADGTGYTIGIEWEAIEEFVASATRIIDSFTLVGDARHESNADDHRDAADSRSAKQRAKDGQ